LKTRNLIALVATAIIILILVATSCAPAGGPTVTVTVTPKATSTSTPTATTKVETKEPIYKVLNPVGRDTATDLAPLAPRIDALAGKKIAFVMAEGSPVIMPALWPRVQKEFPTATWVYTESRTTGPIRLTSDEEKGVQAMIIGNAW
jgi:hypothetical protein